MIRELRTTDLRDICAIEIACQITPWGETAFASCIDKPNYFCWVNEHEGQVVAFAITTIVVGECHVLDICVLPTEQHKGFGLALMQHILSHAKAQKADLAFLEVRPSNTQAIRLYQYLGFNEIGLRKGYYKTASGGTEDGLLFAVQL